MSWMTTPQRVQHRHYRTQQLSFSDKRCTTPLYTLNDFNGVINGDSGKNSKYRTLSLVENLRSSLVKPPRWSSPRAVLRRSGNIQSATRSSLANETTISSLLMSCKKKKKQDGGSHLKSQFLRHISNTITGLVKRDDGVRNRGGYPTEKKMVSCSLIYGPSVDSDLVDWKMSRRHFDICVLVELLVLLAEREKVGRQRIEEEAISSYFQLQFQERDWRKSAYCKKATGHVLGWNLMNDHNTSLNNATSDYFPIQKRLFECEAPTPPQRGRDYKSRSEANTGVKPDFLFKEELASRQLIVFVEDGLRQQLMMMEASKRWSNIDGPLCIENGGYKDNNENETSMMDDDNGVMETGCGETMSQAEDIAGCQVVNNRLFQKRFNDPVRRAVPADISPLVDSGYFDSVTTARATSTVTIVTGNVAAALQTKITAEQSLNAMDKEQLGCETVEDTKIDDMVQMPDEMQPDTCFIEENERLPGALLDLCCEEERTLMGIMGLDEFDAAQLNGQSAASVLSPGIINATTPNLENMHGETGVRRSLVYGNSPVESGSQIAHTPVAHESLTLLNEHNSSGSGRCARDVISSNYSHDIQAVQEAAFVAVVEEEEQERAKLEKEADEKYSFMLWKLEIMGQQQAVVLEEQRDREGVEYREMGHWAELQFLQCLEFAHLIVDASNATLEDREWW